MFNFTPALVAERVTNSASAYLAISRANVVFPVPGGPQSNIETGLPDSTTRRKAAPCLSRGSWPTTSSRVRGRIRAASGADLAMISSARLENKSIDARVRSSSYQATLSP